MKWLSLLSRHKASRLLGWSASLAAGLYGLVGLTIYFDQDKFVLHPSEAPRASYSETQPWVATEPEGGAPVATIIVFHGNAGSARGRGYLSHPLNALGFRVVVVEYPGFDGRAGDATVAAAADQAPGDFDLIRKAYPDEPVILVGESFGAGIAAQVAAQRKDAVCGAVLVTPWYSLTELAQEVMPWLPVRAMLHQELDSKAALVRYAGPTTIVGAARDEVIPVRHAQRLAQEVPGARAVVMPEVGHNNWWTRTTKADWQAWLPRCASLSKNAELPSRDPDQPGSKP